LYLRNVNAQHVQWAQSVAIPEILKLIKQQDNNEAFSLAKRAKKYIPENSVLTELWTRICKDYSINTTPAGANIFYREYSAINESWQYLGQSPLENISLPQGTYRWKIEKEEFDTHECVTDRSFDVRLREGGHLGKMVWIEAWKFKVPSSSFDKAITIETPAYLIDKYEVTNEEFKRFVNQGGYENRKFWRESQFLKEGKKISWKQAISNFVDKTGQPGPATWEKGNYPEGHSKHPVSGISWFEADAYARFIGKSLPTVYHWEHAASFRESIVIVPYSNFTKGETAPVGSHMGVGETGLYDMAGNVKEWCFNATEDANSHRYILGGGRGEQTYLFTMRDSRSPWNRSVINGFRCVQYQEREGLVSDALFTPLGQKSIRDYSIETPCSDQEYQVIKRQFDYDQTQLNAVVESIDDSSPFWRKEKITFDAAYDGERIIAFLFLPRSVEPPYQVVVYWPAGGTSKIPEFTDLPQREWTEYIITGGRALLFPVYKGMFQRRLATWPDPRHTPLKFRDLIIQVSKDLQRSIDYLETRDDIDKERIAYYGVSGGATFGPLALALECRFKAAVLVVGGFYTWMELPAAVDPLNHAPRVNTPVLMINGKEDFYFPVETSQIPMFNLLGTPEEDREHKLYSGGHGLLGLFSKQIRGDVLGWLDRYLGPVNGTRNDMK
jgi:formylglycine-generating enzyme required for sulfatase activity/cephalosporin-C deacetylase-like acetyl esterase